MTTGKQLNNKNKSSNGRNDTVPSVFICLSVLDHRIKKHVRKIVNLRKQILQKVAQPMWDGAATQNSRPISNTFHSATSPTKASDQRLKVRPPETTRYFAFSSRVAPRSQKNQPMACLRYLKAGDQIRDVPRRARCSK